MDSRLRENPTLEKMSAQGIDRDVRRAKQALQKELNGVEVDPAKGGPTTATVAAARLQMLLEAWEVYSKANVARISAAEELLEGATNEQTKTTLQTQIDDLERDYDTLLAEFTEARWTWVQCEGTLMAAAAAQPAAPVAAAPTPPVVRDQSDPSQFRASPATLPKVDCDSGMEAWNTWNVSWQAFLGASGLGYLKPREAHAEEDKARIQQMKWDQLWLALEQASAQYVRANLPTASWGDPDAALQLLDKKVKGATNLSVHRNQFEGRRQKEGEKIDAYATEIRLLAQRCGFTMPVGNCQECGKEQPDVDYTEARLRDRLISGITDQELRRRVMLLPHSHEFEPALKEALTFEACKRDAQTLGSSAAPVAAVASKENQKPKPSNQQTPFRCPNCTMRNAAAHKRVGCPAIKAKCRDCDKVGHFAARCPQGSRVDETGGQATGEIRLGGPPAASMTVGVGTVKAQVTYVAAVLEPSPLTLTSVQVEVAEYPEIRAEMDVLPDTGANIVIIPAPQLELFGARPEQLGNREQPPPAPCTANGSSTGWRVLGTMLVNLKKGGLVTQVVAYVIEGAATPIISCEACKALGIIPQSFPEQHMPSPKN